MVDASSIAFWGILGGLSLLCVVGIVLFYYVCYSRNPRQCMPTESEELLETTIQREEIHTVSSETHAGGESSKDPTMVHKTEQVCRVTMRQQSRSNTFKHSDPVKIRVTSQTPHSSNSDMVTKSVLHSKGSGQSPRSHTPGVGTPRNDSGPNTPRLGHTQITSIGTVS